MNNGELKAIQELLETIREFQVVVKRKSRELCEHLKGVSKEERIAYFSNCSIDDIDDFCKIVDAENNEYYELLEIAKSISDSKKLN